MVKPKKKGVKRIKQIAGKFFPHMGNGKCLVIAADDKCAFEVEEWFEGTTDKEKDSVKWLLEDGPRNILLMQFGNRGPRVNSFAIPPAKCGAFHTYYLEASLTGSIDKSMDNGLLIRGYCKQVVVKSKWTKADGSDISEKEPISYGDDVRLHMETEGLCDSILTIDVYSKRLGPDLRIMTYTGVSCPNGEVNLLIRDTFSWFAKMKWAIEANQFYVTVKAKEVEGLIPDKTPHADTSHARFLNATKKLLNTPKLQAPLNTSPVRLGNNELNSKRYDLCGFSRIEVKDEEDRVVLFDEEKLHLKGETNKDFVVSEEIHYDFAKWDILGPMPSRF
jgi:hypothetical protein